MFNKFIKTGKDHIGIDIGPYSVKAVELIKDKDAFRIKNIGYAKVKHPNTKENIVKALTEAAAMAKITPNKYVNVAVSGSSVVIRFIELPRMSADELKNAVIFEAEKYIPFSINEVIVDHQLLVPHLGDNKMLVLLIAAKKDLVSERLELIAQAGLSVNILDVASLANVNAFFMTAKRNKSEIAAVINIGAKATDINIASEDVLYFTRSIQMGGDDLTKSLAETMSLSFKEAEDLKVTPANKTAEVNENVKTVLHTIVDEIRLSFSYYENQSGRNIEKVYFGGGGANSVNMREVLQEQLGVGVEFWGPAMSMVIDPLIDSRLVESLKYQLGTAVGLALR